MGTTLIKSEWYIHSQISVCLHSIWHKKRCGKGRDVEANIQENWTGLEWLVPCYWWCVLSWSLCGWNKVIFWLVPELITSQTIKPLICVLIPSVYLYDWQSRKCRLCLAEGHEGWQLLISFCYWGNHMYL